MTDKPVEYGVFLPVGSGGWIPSTTTPELDASYGYNKDVTQLAERLGFDFTLSQAVWRGYGGPSKHFDVNLESLITSAGLAASTEEIGIWSTVNTALLHPAVAAKMIATEDQISGGRTGLNIVAGGNRMSENQMGIGQSMDNKDKYRRAKEWVEVVKLLWTSPGPVDYDGEFFQLKDCQSMPKPLVGVPNMICAAVSDVGLRFTAENLDGALIEGTSRDSMIELGQRAKRIGAEAGSGLKTYCVFMVIPGETDADAQRRIDLYNSGRDDVAMNRMLAEFGHTAPDKTKAAQVQEEWNAATAISTGTIHGSPETITEKLADIISHGDLDSAVFIMPDFIDDLTVIGEQVVPALIKGGLGAKAVA